MLDFARDFFCQPPFTLLPPFSAYFRASFLLFFFALPPTITLRFIAISPFHLSIFSRRASSEAAGLPQPACR